MLFRHIFSRPPDTHEHEPCAIWLLGCAWLVLAFEFCTALLWHILWFVYVFVALVRPRQSYLRARHRAALT